MTFSNIRQRSPCEAKLKSPSPTPLCLLLLTTLQPPAFIPAYLSFTLLNPKTPSRFPNSQKMDHSRAGDGAGDEVTVAARSSLIDSLKGCGLSGIRIDKQQLNTKVMMPHYLRFALRDSIRLKDPIAGASATTPPQNVVPPPPEAPLVVFINPRSGGRHGQKLKQRLQELISEEQVPPSKKCFPLSIL